MALFAGRNEKEIGHFLMFPAKLKLAVIWRNFSAHTKMFDILPLCPFVDYSLA